MEEQETNPALALLQGLAQLRDGFLIGAGVVYLLGYVVWSWNAYQNDLGLLPALEAQYFVAGIPPALILVALYFALPAVIRFSNALPSWFNPKVAKSASLRRRVVDGILGGSFVLVIGLAAVLSEDQLTWAIVAWLLAGMFLLPLSLAADEANQPNATPRTTAPRSKLGRLWSMVSERRDQIARLIPRWLRTFYFCYIVTALAAGGISLYVRIGYVNLPQEFGGLRPRCAYLDIEHEQVSAETLSEIAPHDARGPDAGVIRSSKVEVLFSGGGMLLVRPGENMADRRVYEIGRDTVQAISSCD